MDSKENLIACRLHSVEEIAREIGVDSLGYLSVENVQKIAAEASCGFCVGCFTGQYPIEVPGKITKNKFEMKISENK